MELVRIRRCLATLYDLDEVMTYLQSLIEQKEPLEAHEVSDLKNWLQVLEGDCADFGETYEDTIRMNKMRAAINAALCS